MISVDNSLIKKLGEYGLFYFGICIDYRSRWWVVGYTVGTLSMNHDIVPKVGHIFSLTYSFLFRLYK